MKIMLLSKWSSGVVYDLYYFLSSLPEVEVVPCSYLYPFNTRVRMKELNDVKSLNITEDMSVKKINCICSELKIDIVCVSWLIEIKELFPILKEVDRKIFLFPHSGNKILEKYNKYENIFLVHNKDYRFNKNFFEMTYYISRKIANTEKQVKEDGSYILSGYSNLQMHLREKRKLLNFIDKYSLAHRVKLTKILLNTLYPLKYYIYRRIANKIFQILKPGSLDYGTKIRNQILNGHYDWYFDKFTKNPNIDVQNYIPYDQMCNEIAGFNFVDVTPAVYSEFLPNRATLALATGTPIVLKKEFCPPLEKIIATYNNGVVYKDFADILKLDENKSMIAEISKSSLENRHRFTLEKYTNEFSEFLKENR